MAKHTPGPYVLRPHGVIYGGPLRAFSNGQTQEQIGLATGAEWMCHGEREANARIFAAAPELLEALTWLHGKYAATWHPHEASELAHLLAKAEGLDHG